MIKDYWKSLKANGKADLATRLDTTTAYLRHVFLYDKQVGAKLARDIERETDGKVTAAILRPDLFGPLPDAKSVK